MFKFLPRLFKLLVPYLKQFIVRQHWFYLIYDSILILIYTVFIVSVFILLNGVYILKS